MKFFKMLHSECGSSESDAAAVAAVSSLHEHGYAHLPGVLSDKECDAICDDFTRYVAKHRQEADKHVMGTGRHSRLTNMHLVSDRARAAIAKPVVMKTLDAFFGDRAFVATSLFFEQSSEQTLHRDTPFFHTRPHNIFAGIWFALEDVHAEAGPLQYYPGGHLIEIESIQATGADQLGEAFNHYSGRVAEEVHKRGIKPEIALIKKGDCFIWHPELPHGGTPILSAGMTRKSMVFHCAPERETMYGIEEFFGVRLFASKDIRKVPMTRGRLMLQLERPMFAPNS
ncbi:phytanoyl-CoA dioxygenase family protein [Xanthomonas vasicola pv. musacearum]|uniref:phytanoyl-CoA dioxygenase family protein n=1 Tax=Xanthomonas vasicola TaxID=56459 RepID=UPI000F609B4D|nr:phytanoyl-CoA dioxygenase family protein [Xanthomonas vasicola]RRJ39355.1 phytanoyl-CoA dioxygenase family protein [Xanthomonas vasicola pv. musacearum]